MRIEVFIVTCSLTASRRNRCQGIFDSVKDRLGLGWRFVGAREPSDITPQVVAAHVLVEPLSDPRLHHLNAHSRPLGQRHVSNALNHLDALRLASECPDGTACLVVEDDIVPLSGWADRLAAAVADAPKDFDVIFTGIPSGSSAAFTRLEKKSVLPICESYIVTPGAAKRLAAGFLPVRFPTPAHLGFLAAHLGLDLYTVNPAVFNDGSKIGAFVGTVDAGNNSRLILNQTYHDAFRLLGAPEGHDATEELEAVARAIDASPFSGHPDMLHAMAMVKWRTRGPAIAMPIFASAVAAALAANAVVNSESRLLRDYIDLHRHIQPPSPGDSSEPKIL